MCGLCVFVIYHKCPGRVLVEDNNVNMPLRTVLIKHLLLQSMSCWLFRQYRHPTMLAMPLKLHIMLILVNLHSLPPHLRPQIRLLSHPLPINHLQPRILHEHHPKPMLSLSIPLCYVLRPDQVLKLCLWLYIVGKQLRVDLMLGWVFQGSGELLSGVCIAV